MAEPFVRRAARGDGVLGRFLGRPTRGSVVREIEDLLARTERVCQIPPARIAELAESRGVDLERRLRTPRVNLYRRFLQHCLVDQAVSAEEQEDLCHLRELLRIDDVDAIRVHEEVAHAIYGRAVDQVLADLRLDPDEEQFLRQLRDQLEISETSADRLYEDGEVRAKQRYLDEKILPDNFIVSSREATLQVAGDSETSLEAAITRAVEEAGRAVPDFYWMELGQLGADVENGRIARWRVKLKIKRQHED